MINRKIYTLAIWVILVFAASSGVVVAADGPPPPSAGPLSLFGGGGNADEVVKVKAEFTVPVGGKPGRLFVTATIKPEYHIYSITQAPGGPVRTEIKIPDSADFKIVGPFLAATPPKKKTEPEAFKDLIVETHEGSISWHAPLEIKAGVDPAKLKIAGKVFAQPCTETSCMAPGDYPFTATLGEGAKVPEEQLRAPSASPPPANASSVPPTPPPASKGPPAPPSPSASTASTSTTPPAPVAPAAPPSPPVASAPKAPPAAEPKAAAGSEFPWRPYVSFAAFTELLSPEFNAEEMSRNVVGQLAGSSLMWELLWGFLGGIILNIMPCVLPVIGLKLLSFVDQAGHNRGRALMLNVWYSLGILAVFLLLAFLAVGLNLGWGHLFKYAGFNIALTCIVFAMGLSFLGIWEIPIPGFAGGGKAQQLAAQEGVTGAFFKGVITTVLATPCTGPFMATALAWAVNQPPHKTFAVFGSVGLGMASPYLLIGAFPGLLRFLPKPGAWMETFKQIMGFVLLGTVVYMLTFLQPGHVVPTVGLLIGLWIACWWIARVSFAAEASARARAWVEGVIIVGLAWIAMFPGLKAFLPEPYAVGGLADVMHSRQDRELARGVAVYLEEQRQQGRELTTTGRVKSPPKTVLVDFTADWCATCKTLEATMLNTAEVRALVARNRVVTLQADWTHDAPEVSRFMKFLGAQQVPVIAIFPADRPNQPIIFRGAYTQKDLLDALERAGASKG